MPYSGTGNGNNLFGGWVRDIIRLPSATGAFKIDVVLSDGATVVGTLPAGAFGRYQVRWDRFPIGAGALGAFTFIYMGPVAADTGWAADTGIAKKTATAAYVPGALLTFSAAYVQAEQTASAVRIQTIENALRDVTQEMKAVKDLLLASGQATP